MRTKNFLPGFIFTAVAAFASLVACSQGSAAEQGSCDTVCASTPDCGGESCLSHCMAMQSTCIDTGNEAAGAFDSWAGCGPVLLCENGSYSAANCLVEQLDVEAKCSGGTFALGSGGDAGHVIVIAPPDGGTGTNGDGGSGNDSAFGFDASGNPDTGACVSNGSCSVNCLDNCGNSCSGGSCSSGCVSDGTCAVNCLDNCGNSCSGGSCSSGCVSDGSCSASCLDNCGNSCSGGSCGSCVSDGSCSASCTDNCGNSCSGGSCVSGCGACDSSTCEDECGDVCC